VAAIQTVQQIRLLDSKQIPKQTLIGVRSSIISRMVHCIQLIPKAAHHLPLHLCHGQQLYIPQHLCSSTTMPCKRNRQRQTFSIKRVVTAVPLALANDGTLPETL
jgi:hypothetical protein